MRSPLLADASKSLVLAIDYQEPVLAGVGDRERLIENSLLLFEAALALDVPLVVTEQNPEKLGPTVGPLRRALGARYKPVSKMAFSALDETVGGVKRAISAAGAKDLVICGIEAHICVLQTALDALHARFSVHLVADCISAAPGKKEAALETARGAGAIVTDIETLTYSWLREAGTVAFRQVLPTIKKFRGSAGRAEPTTKEV